MSRIAGTRKGETYPDRSPGAGGFGGLLQLGSDAPTEDVAYSSSGPLTMVRDNSGPPANEISIPMRNFKSGNLLVVMWAVYAQEDPDSPGAITIFNVQPFLDETPSGGGLQTISGADLTSPVQLIPDISQFGRSAIVSVRVSGFPNFNVRFNIENTSGTNIIVPSALGVLDVEHGTTPGNTHFVAFEIDASIVSQFSPNILVDVP